MFDFIYKGVRNIGLDIQSLFSWQSRVLALLGFVGGCLVWHLGFPAFAIIAVFSLYSWFTNNISCVLQRFGSADHKCVKALQSDITKAMPRKDLPERHVPDCCSVFSDKFSGKKVN